METDRRYRVLFFVALLFNVALLWFLLADHRVPIGHDSFTYFATQQWFLSNPDLPGWIPSSGHGMPAATAFTAQAGLVQLVLLFFPSLFSGASFLPLFHLGLFVDELLLLTGVWLLARRWFDSPWTVFFVACAASGSALWSEQVWFGLHSVAAVPLVLALGHGFFDTGERWRGALALNLLFMQGLGQLPGAILLPLIAVILYVAAVRPDRSRLTRRRSDPGWLALGLAPLLLTQAIAFTGSVVRTQAGSMSLGEPGALLGALISMPVSRDASFFVGSLTLPFAAIALVAAPRPAARALAFLAAGFVLVAIARFLPGLASRDALVQAAPFAKLVVIFLAGAGFHHVLRHGLTGPAFAAGAVCTLLIGSAAGGLSMFLMAEQVPPTPEWLTSLSATPPPPLHLRAFAAEFTGSAALFAFLGLGILLLWRAGKRVAPMALVITMLLHPVDLFAWKFRTTWSTTAAIGRHLSATTLAPPAYVPRRLGDLRQTARAKELQTTLYDSGSGLGAVTDPWFGFDSALPSPNAHELAEPVDSLVRALAAPPARPLPARLTGAAADKLRFFPGAVRRPAAEIAEALRHPDADALYVEGAAAGSPAAAVDVPIEVTSFGANHITVRLTAPGPGLLYYADAWDSAWAATVSDRDAPVLRANLAYKAVEISAGSTVVTFRRSAGALPWIARALGLNALLLVLAIFALAGSQLRRAP